MKSAILFVLISTLSFSAMANDGFAGTKWGMSRKQVIESLPQNYTLSKVEHAPSEIVAYASLAGKSNAIAFGFRDSGLHRVDIFFDSFSNQDDANNFYVTIAKGLMKKYGSACELKESDFAHTCLMKLANTRITLRLEKNNRRVVLKYASTQSEEEASKELMNAL